MELALLKSGGCYLVPLNRLCYRTQCFSNVKAGGDALRLVPSLNSHDAWAEAVRKIHD